MLKKEKKQNKKSIVEVLIFIIILVHLSTVNLIPLVNAETTDDAQVMIEEILGRVISLVKIIAGIVCVLVISVCTLTMMTDHMFGGGRINKSNAKEYLAIAIVLEDNTLLVVIIVVPQIFPKPLYLCLQVD